MAGIPEALERVRSLTLPPAALLEVPLAVAGVGLSGGPARLLAARAPRGRYLSLSGATEAEPTPGALALFSSGLSPNARRAGRVGPGARVYFGSVDPDEPGDRGRALRRFLGTRESWVVPLPSDPPHDALVRFVDPAAATFAALRWLDRVRPVPGLDEVPGAYHAALGRAPEHDPSVGDEATVVMVTAGIDPAEAHGLVVKWAEGTLCALPHLVDGLELAHGPLQTLAGRRALVLGLETEATAPLFDRVRAALDPGLHRYLGLRAKLPAPAALMEHDALLDALLLARFAAQGLPPPGAVHDAPLYDLGA